MKNNKGIAGSLTGSNLLRPETYSGTYKGYFKIWFIVLLLAVLMAGCGGSDSSGGHSAPKVDSTVPADLAIGVSIDPNITATFGDAMDPLTITKTTFTLTGPALEPVDGEVSLSADGLTAIFKPISNLATDTTFTATLTTEVKNLRGKALAADKIWSFTTGTTLSPAVVSTVPLDLASGVPTDVIISAEFNVAMDPLTITKENFTVTAGSNIDGQVALSADGKTATFTPTKLLAPNTEFVARITTGVKDPSGNAMKADKAWVFQTGL